VGKRPRLPTDDHDSRTSPNLPVALLLLAGGAAFALELRHVWPFTADDAFITFRYAQNWIAGFGPNFNAGGPRAEGVTSFGYLLLCTIPELLRIDPVGFAKAVGVASALATAALAARLARELFAEGAALAGAFAAALLLGFHATAIHAASGMETLLAAALLTALVHAHVRPAASGYHIGALSLATGLVRPELNVAAGLLLAQKMWRSWPDGRLAFARGVALTYLLPGAIFFAARAAYYDHLLPIPYYEKIAGGALLPAIGNVLAFAEIVLATTALFAAVPTLLAPRAVAPAWLAISAVMAAGALPDPVMDFDYRYCMPAAPIAFAIAGAGFARLALLVAALRPAQRALVPGFTLAAVALVVASSAEPARLALRERRAYGQALANSYYRLGHVLADYRRGAARAPVLAIGDAGAIPYYSGLHVIDTYSLNDPAIAIDGRDDPAYVLDQDPDLVAVVSEQGPEFHAHWANRHDGPLFEAARARGMQPAVILTFSAQSFLYLMAQPDSDIARYLQRVYLDRKSPGAGT
jgi:hypothetical protein